MGRGSAKSGSPRKKRGTRKAPAKRALSKRAKPASKAATPRRSPKSKSDAATLAIALKAAQARQAASAEILRVISQSPADAQPVFEAIVLAAVRLLGCDDTFVTRCDGATYTMIAATTLVGRRHRLRPVMHAAPRPVDPAADFPSRAIASRKNLYLPDWSAIELPAFERFIHENRGFNSALYLPMLRDGQCVGVLGLASKKANHFSARDIALAESFRDQALIAIENARLFNEVQTRTRDLSESLQQQTATADVLKVISRSAFDLQTVLDTLVESAARLCEADNGIILQPKDDGFGLTASCGLPADKAEFIQRTIFRLGDGTLTSRVLATGNVVHAHDVMEVPGFNLRGDPEPARTRLGVPLLRDGLPSGVFVLTRMEVRPFTDRQIELVQTFAAQAVIAIENARLFNETKEALERQTATADILKVIASSPDDVQPVFEAIAANANRLIGGYSTAVVRFIDGMAHLAAFTPLNPEADAVLKASLPGPTATFQPFEFASRGVPTQVEDTEVLGEERLLAISRARGFRSALYAPLMNGTVPIGVIGVTRISPGKFAPHHVQLLQTFADQAVIAIQNVRLFNETQEALQRQTATADILKVIASSPSDVKPVFDQILNSIEHLIKSDERVIVLSGDDGVIRVGAARSPRENDLYKAFPRSLKGSAVEVVIRERRLLAFADALNDPESPKSLQAVASRSGARSVMMAPLLSESRAIGSIVVSRATVDPFNEKECSLLSTFADQAVIAIENVRLFNELQARTRDLSEALQQQTATADVLKVISRSTFDLDAVLTTLTKSAVGLCRAARGAVLLRDGDVLRVRADAGNAPEFIDFLKANPIAPSRQTITGRAFLSGDITQVPDVLTDPDYDFGPAHEIGKFRAGLAVPLLRQGRVEGVFALSRPEPGGFSDREIELIRTFADQAVIAIENVRLFNEVQARTKELAASLEDLRSAQDRLVQTEKLASLGQLTAGIAHEIKNPLNFVNNFSALSAELTDELNDLLAQADLTGKMREEIGELTKLLKDNLEKVVQHGKRADSIVKNMLLHSREGGGEQRLADINALVDESLNLAYHGARAEKPGFNIALQRDFDTGAGSAELFPQEISRALLNLISNGFYAATKRKNEIGGAGFEPVLQAGTRDLGSSVEIRIRDNGTGIPAEVKEKMFNPFFTTKPAGEGTGLGLSMTHDIIVKQHGGRIDVESRLGEFTEFTIVLPRIGSQRPAKA